MNRIGNLIVPNDNYCTFETWLTPILDEMLLEQKTQVLFNLPQVDPRAAANRTRYAGGERLTCPKVFVCLSRQNSPSSRRIASLNQSRPES